MDGVYGTHLRTNLCTRKFTNIISAKFTDNSCANYRDKESRTNANVAAQLQALSSVQDLKEYAPIAKFGPEQIERCEITSSIASQNRIGWQYFIRGRLTLPYLPIVKNITDKIN